MNIKNLALEVLDIDTYFSRLQGIHHKTTFQRQVNFRVDVKIRFFTLKLASQPKKSVFEVEKLIFENFLCALPDGDISSNARPETPRTPPDHSGTFQKPSE